MYKVQNFLGCCALDAAVNILAWIGFVLGIIITFILFVFIFATKSACEIINEKFLPLDCDTSLTAIRIGFIVAIIVLFIPLYITYLLIQGIKTRNAKKIYPAVVLQAIGVIVSIIRLLLSLTSGVAFIKAVLSLAFSVYFFIVHSSLHDMIKNEGRIV